MLYRAAQNLVDRFGRLLMHSKISLKQTVLFCFRCSFVYLLNTDIDMKKILHMCVLVLSLNGYAQTVTDYDGNMYPVISIGTQQWMGKNLRTKHFSDGTPILNTGIANWYQFPLEEPRYAQPYLIPGSNDSLSIGLWYNYPAVGSSRNLCPSGWRVASDADWSLLIHFLDSTSSTATTLESAFVGGLLKDTLLWVQPNTGASNAVGFAVLPVSDIGGQIIPPAGHVCCTGLNAAFWCGGTQWVPGTTCYDRQISTYDAGIIRNTDNYSNGKSVRCISNTPSSIHQSIEQSKQPALSPNPAKSYFTIAGAGKSIGPILLYDLRGVLRLSMSTSSNSQTIDISILPEGIYFVVLPDLNSNLKLVILD